MTIHIFEECAKPEGLVSPPDRRIRMFPRSLLMAGLYFIGIVNGLAGQVADAIGREGFLVAVLDTFGINAIVLFACVTALNLIVRSGPSPVRGPDLAMAMGFALLVLVPNNRVSWFAVALLALYELVFRRGDARAVAAASILLGVTVTQFWIRPVISLFAGPLTHFDATLVAFVLGFLGDGVGRSGNVIDTGSDFTLAIMVSCSSLTNLSLAGLCWLTVTRAFRPIWSLREWRGFALLAAGVVTLNVSRMVLMGLDLSLYRLLHDGIGAPIFNLITLTFALAVSIYGIRHELGLRPARA